MRDRGGLVDVRIDAAHRGDQIGVLHHLRIRFRPAESDHSTGGLDRAVAHIIAPPGRADDGFADVAVGVVNLPALAEHADPVGVFVLHGEVVEDVAGLGAERLAAALAVGRAPGARS